MRFVSNFGMFFTITCFLLHCRGLVEVVKKGPVTLRLLTAEIKNKNNKFLFISQHFSIIQLYTWALSPLTVLKTMAIPKASLPLIIFSKITFYNIYSQLHFFFLPVCSLIGTLTDIKSLKNIFRCKIPVKKKVFSVRDNKNFVIFFNKFLFLFKLLII